MLKNCKCCEHSNEEITEMLQLVVEDDMQINDQIARETLAKVHAMLSIEKRHAIKSQNDPEPTPEELKVIDEFMKECKTYKDVNKALDIIL